MASRTATINITNNTSADWAYTSQNAEHGKITQEPPSPLGKGGSGTLVVQNKSDALIGPKGTYSWSATIGGQTVTITLSWNHPFSGATSAYSLYSSPAGVVDPVMTPQNPSGDPQTINFTVTSPS